MIEMFELEFLTIAILNLFILYFILSIPYMMVIKSALNEAPIS